MCFINLLDTWGLQQLLVSTMTLHTAFFVFEGQTVFKIFEPVAEGEKKMSDSVNFCFHAVRLQPSSGSRHFSMRVRKHRGVGTSPWHPPEPTHICDVSVFPCLLYLILTQSFVKVKLALLS